MIDMLLQGRIGPTADAIRNNGIERSQVRKRGMSVTHLDLDGHIPICHINPPSWQRFALKLRIIF
jgi:hypothetical protein